MQTVATYWKQCAELGTVWWRKYHGDPFFRTEVNVVALQALFALVIMITIGISFSVLYHNVSLAIVEGIEASLESNAPTSLGPTIVNEIQNIRTLNLGSSSARSRSQPSSLAT